MKPKILAKLKYTIWFYLVVFALLIVTIVWVFQILLFDTVYQQRKLASMKQIGEELSASMNTEDEVTDSLVSTWLASAISANEAGVFTYVARYDNEHKLVAKSIPAACVDYFSSKSNANNQNNANSANGANGNGTANGGLGATDATDGAKQDYFPDIQNVITQFNLSKSNYLCDMESSSTNGGYFYFVTKVSNSKVDGYLVLISTLNSITETLNVIQSQLIIDSLIVIAISFFVALYLAIKLSKPIDKMSKTAKKWANGDNDVTFVGSDFQELSELADALNYAKDGIAQTSVLQRDLLANVSHDLKTPLTMIKAYAEMIRDISGDNKAKRDMHTKVIIDEADRLTMLVNDILDLSKLQNGMNMPDLKVINLSEVLETVLFRMTDFAENNGFTILTEVEKDLYTLCDRKQIEQVFYNLIGNSINYTGEDKTISVRLKRKGSIILFETIDSGKGISEEKLPTIWNKYYRYADTHQRPIKGTGLGLSIVKTILEGHNLKFGVMSEKDVGSNFFVEFVAYDEQV